MNKPLAIGLFCEGAASATELVAETLADEGFRPRLLDPRAKSSVERETLARLDMVAVFYPTGPRAAAVIGVASGMGKPAVVLLDPATDRATLPRTALVTKSIRQFLARIRRVALRLGRQVTHISPKTLEQFGACAPGIDWFRSHYPQGGPVTRWTEAEQRRLLLAGGAPWLQGAVDYGLISFFAMVGQDFSGTELARLRMARVNLTRINFSRADLANGNLEGATLSGARLGAAVLTGLRLRGAMVEGADFSNAAMGEAVLNAAHGSQAVFAGADATGAVFHDARLPQADFGNARLAQASFRGADLTGARFDGANMTGTDLRGTVLDGVRLSPAQLAVAILDTGARAALSASPPTPPPAPVPEPAL